MKAFYLGYKEPLDEELTEFISPAHADWYAEEWVEVQAESLDEAKGKYEGAFLDWQERTK